MNANSANSTVHRKPAGSQRQIRLANVRLWFAEMGEQHERDGGSGGEGDE